MTDDLFVVEAALFNGTVVRQKISRKRFKRLLYDLFLLEERDVVARVVVNVPSVRRKSVPGAVVSTRP